MSIEALMYYRNFISTMSTLNNDVQQTGKELEVLQQNRCESSSRRK